MAKAEIAASYRAILEETYGKPTWRSRVWRVVRFGLTARGSMLCDACSAVLDRTYFGRLTGHAPGCGGRRA